MVRSYARFCPLCRGLDVVGDRWTLVIVNELLMRPHRYGELRAALPGMGSNVLSERLRKLEAAGVVERRPGAVGEGVEYALTARGEALGPALAELRKWGAEVLTLTAPETPDGSHRYDMSYVVPDGLELAEEYEWHVDEVVLWIRVDGATVEQGLGAARDPAVVMRTTRRYVQRVAAWEATWDEGLASGDVTMEGSEQAWERMHAVTGDPTRRGLLADLAAG